MFKKSCSSLIVWVLRPCTSFALVKLRFPWSTIRKSKTLDNNNHSNCHVLFLLMTREAMRIWRVFILKCRYLNQFTIQIPLWASRTFLCYYYLKNMSTLWSNDLFAVMEFSSHFNVPYFFWKKTVQSHNFNLEIVQNCCCLVSFNVDSKKRMKIQWKCTISKYRCKLK